MSKKEVHIHVDENFDAMAKRVTGAWHRAENGEDVFEHHTSLVSGDITSSAKTTLFAKH